MANTNVLEGWACPACGSTYRFRITATAILTVTDDGVEGLEDPEWYGPNAVTCSSCGHFGVVREFSGGAA
jgi:hypothetical protein